MKNFRKFACASMVILGAIVGMSANIAFAGQCPASQEGAALAERPSVPKGVSDTVVESIDLGSESSSTIVICACAVSSFSQVESFRSTAMVAGQRSSLRLKAKSSNMRNCRVPIVHRAGETVRETADVSHYWVTRGKASVELLSADVKGRE